MALARKDLLEQAKVVLDGWNKLGVGVTFGELTPAALSADIKKADSIDTQIVNVENQLAALRNSRQDVIDDIAEKVKRVRAAVKGIYGDNSTQYEQVGGTRLSERKAPTRKTAAA